MRTNPFRTAAVAASAAALMLLASACGDDSETTAAPQDGQAATAGASSATVDGKALDAQFVTTCAKLGDILALALVDDANGTYGRLSVSASVTGADTVQAVGIAGTQGGSSGTPYALGYGNGQPGGSAKLTKDGNTFTITGEGVGAPDLTDPLAGPSTATFEITFACAEIVGA
ncbi:lipoprotein LpqH [Nocardia farcinica]|uniref:lipoprotein LpqH n=1 Tax=Nocardia farcinica TaxID=37329 RepID=UPI002458FCB2|nr:lipoprotein LpqH [Nocardia farcinica]